MSENVRVRFAPSPTGPLHIGGVRTALYNYLFAKKNNGKFLLRIEDTDQTRYVPGAEEYIIDSLKWCGLEVDEGIGTDVGEYGPYRQSERKAMYREYAERLVEQGNAYYAFDTPEELEIMRENMKKEGIPSPQYNAVTRQYMKNSLTLSADEVKARIDKGDPYVVRINVPRKEEVKVNDIVRGWVTFQSNQLDDKVLFKGDGMPTYHLANVVDDHLMKISHVIRGEEWLPSTPIHILLYQFFGWENEMPQFAHLPLLLRPDGNGKLSKRDGDRLGFPVFPLDWKNPNNEETASGYREKGFFPQPFINMLALLGWNPGDNQEIFTMEELIQSFSLERIGKAGAKFDFEKAQWFNQQYIKTLDKQYLGKEFQAILKDKNIECSIEFAERAADLLKERITFLPDLWEDGKFFFGPPKSYDEKVIQKNWDEKRKEAFKDLQERLNKLSPFDASLIETEVKNIMEKYELKFGEVLPLFRVMLSGVKAGPPLFEIASLLGKEEVNKRMNLAIEKFN